MALPLGVVHVSFELLWVNNPSNPKGLVGFLVWSGDLRCIPGQSSSSRLNWDVLCSPEGSARRFPSAGLSLSSAFPFVLWPEIPTDQKAPWELGTSSRLCAEQPTTRGTNSLAGLGECDHDPSGWGIRNLPSPGSALGPRGEGCGGALGSPTWSARLTPKLSCLHAGSYLRTRTRLCYQTERPWRGRALLPAPQPKGIALLFRESPSQEPGVVAGLAIHPVLLLEGFIDLKKMSFVDQKTWFFLQQSCGFFLKCLNDLACPNPPWPSQRWRWAQG